MCRTLYVAKIVGIGSPTSMGAVEIRVPSRGMRQTDVHMENARRVSDEVYMANGRR